MEAWRAAKEARELLLFAETAARREAAAERVFLQAECERQHFDSHSLEATNHDALTAKLREARGQYQNAKNLYEEASRYRVPRWTVGSRARLGALHLAYGDKLRRASAPKEVRDPSERAAFAAELGTLARTFDREAAAAYRAALGMASRLPEALRKKPPLGAWLHDACANLAFLDLEAHRRAPSCGALGLGSGAPPPAEARTDR